jgi:hypothetical protein
MFAFSAVWDAGMKRRLITFVGYSLLLGLVYVGALVAGLPLALRLFI